MLREALVFKQMRSFIPVYALKIFNLPSLLLLCLSPSTCYARRRNRLVTIQGPLPYGANNCGGCQPSAQLVAEGICTIPRGQQHCPCHIHRPVDILAMTWRAWALNMGSGVYVSPTSSMHRILRPRAPWPPVLSLWLRGIAPSLAASSTVHVTSTGPRGYFARDMASLGTEHG